MLKDNLKSLREDKGLTKKQVAQGVGINERAYIAYEYGERDVSTETLCKLADFYEVSTDYLLGRTTVKQIATEKPDLLTILAKEFNLTEMQKVIVQAYIAIGPKERDKLIEAIEGFVKAKETAQQAPEPKPSIVQSAPQSPPQSVESLQKQRHVERLGDIENELEQERQAKAKDVI